MELGEGGDPCRSPFVVPFSLLWGLDQWNSGPPAPLLLKVGQSHAQSAGHAGGASVGARGLGGRVQRRRLRHHGARLRLFPTVFARSPLCSLFSSRFFNVPPFFAVFPRFFSVVPPCFPFFQFCFPFFQLTPPSCCLLSWFPFFGRNSGRTPTRHSPRNWHGTQSQCLGMAKLRFGSSATCIFWLFWFL